MSQTSKRLYFISQGALLAGALYLAVITSRAEDWTPVGLLIPLLLLTILGDRFAFEFGNQYVSASFIGLALAMTLLGPAPAALFGALALAIDVSTRRPSTSVTLSNLATDTTFLVLGGLLTRALVGNVHDPHNLHATQGLKFALVVLGVFMATNELNFVLIAIQKRVLQGSMLMAQVRTVHVPILPGQLAAGALTAILAVAYTNLGYPVLFVVAMVILIFQYLALALLRSEERGEQLEARSLHLASMQLGMLATLVETLALRDRMTARHSAAVARYARELAAEVGCSEADQELAHTAGLLHDIGKFALPDRILHAEALSDEDWAVIRRHPQDGAKLVGRLDGYGPVAEAILYHHEHVDGSGYPAGLIGDEIPLTSRIVAICSTYDTLTARDTYRSPMTPQDAITELRRVAGGQLDAELVSSFIAMLEREGPMISVQGDDADFEVELEFERRARLIAQPSTD